MSPGGCARCSTGGAALPREDEYDALFQPVRAFRQSMLEAVVKASTADASAGVVAVKGAVAIAIRGLRTTLAADHATVVDLAVRVTCGDAKTHTDAVAETVLRAAWTSLETHAAVAPIFERASKLLGETFAAGSQRVRAAFAAAVGGARLIAALERHADNVAVVAIVIGALNTVTFDADGLAAIAAAGGFAAVLRALARHADDAVVASGVSMLLDRLAKTAGAKPAVVASGAATALVPVLFKHVGAIDVVKSTTAALRTLSIDPDGADQIVTATGIDALVAALTKHIDSVDVAMAVCSALASLFGFGFDHAFDADGVAVLVSAVVKHDENEAVLVEAMEALCTFITDDDDRAVIEAHGGRAAVLHALERHADGHSGVALAACELLGELAFHDAARAAIIAAGSVGTVVAVVAKYAAWDDVDVVAKAADTLATLSRCAAGRAAIVAAGGIEALVDALIKLGHDAKAATGASSALHSLSSATQPSRQRQLQQLPALPAAHRGHQPAQPAIAPQSCLLVASPPWCVR